MGCSWVFVKRSSDIFSVHTNLSKGRDRLKQRRIHITVTMSHNYCCHLQSGGLGTKAWIVTSAFTFNDIIRIKTSGVW